MEILNRIETLIDEPLAARGYTLVRVQFNGSNRKVLQVMIERLDEASITVGDCSIVSRLISALLDIQDPIKGSYTLEVSSPGLERPLVKLKDYQRFCGKMVVVATHQPINGRKRFQGRLTLATEKEITLELASTPEEQTVPLTLDWENIRAAHLSIDFENQSWNK